MAEFTIKRATTGSRLAEDMIAFRMEKARPSRGSIETYQRRMFARCLAQTAQVTDLALAWPDLEADGAVLVEAFDAWTELPPAVSEAWLSALQQADAPVGDADLLPPEKLTDEQKKAPKSSRSGSDSSAN